MGVLMRVAADGETPVSRCGVHPGCSERSWGALVWILVRLSGVAMGQLALRGISAVLYSTHPQRQV